jgi:hypothetical protein
MGEDVRIRSQVEGGKGMSWVGHINQRQLAR